MRRDWAPEGEGPGGRSIRDRRGSVDRSRRESVGRPPGRIRQHERLCIGQTGATVQPELSERVRTERLRSERLRPAHKSKPPTTGMRARHNLHRVWESDRPRCCRSLLREPPDNPRPREPLAQPFGREHTTPIVQTRGGASLRDHLPPTRRRVNPRARLRLHLRLLAAFEPGSFGGPAGLPAGALGQRAWPNCSGVRRVVTGAHSHPTPRGRRLGETGRKNNPHTTPRLGPAGDFSCVAQPARLR